MYNIFIEEYYEHLYNDKYFRNIVEFNEMLEIINNKENQVEGYFDLFKRNDILDKLIQH